MCHWSAYAVPWTNSFHSSTAWLTSALVGSRTMARPWLLCGRVIAWHTAILPILLLPLDVGPSTSMDSLCAMHPRSFGSASAISVV